MAEIDKCTEMYSVRIPEITKAHLDKLPPNLKQRLKDSILREMELIIHESKYQPGMYLTNGDL